MTAQRFPELGFYALPGHSLEPTQVFSEVAQGDDLGLGSVWISERFNTKDIGVISGIAAATTKNMGIASGLLSQLPLRHPLVIAGYGSTMSAVTGGRFSLGIGRGVDKLASMTGTQPVNLRLLEDYISILRQLWNGDGINYDGPAGTLRNVALGYKVASPPPIIVAAMGDKTCHWAGQHCDGVLLNSLWTDAAVAESVAHVRRGATEAGRDPSQVRVWSIQVTASDVSEEDFLNYVIRRMNTYVLFPPMMSAVCKANGWDSRIADKIRAKLLEIDGPGSAAASGDEHTTRDLNKLRTIRQFYPDEWIYEGNAVGSADECAKVTLGRLNAGADGILLHGSAPAKLASFLAAWPRYRPNHRFQSASVNPGLSLDIRASK